MDKHRQKFILKQEEFAHDQQANPVAPILSMRDVCLNNHEKILAAKFKKQNCVGIKPSQNLYNKSLFITEEDQKGETKSFAKLLVGLGICQEQAIEYDISEIQKKMQQEKTELHLIIQNEQQRHKRISQASQNAAPNQSLPNEKKDKDLQQFERFYNQQRIYFNRQRFSNLCP